MLNRSTSYTPNYYYVSDYTYDYDYYSATPASNFSQLDCPNYSEKDINFLNDFSFWVEGVLLIATAILGIVGNTLASVIISRKEMRNSFNLLLVSLACFDSTYLFVP